MKRDCCSTSEKPGRSPIPTRGKYFPYFSSPITSWGILRDVYFYVGTVWYWWKLVYWNSCMDEQRCYFMLKKNVYSGAVLSKHFMYELSRYLQPKKSTSWRLRGRCQIRIVIDICEFTEDPLLIFTFASSSFHYRLRFQVNPKKHWQRCT